MILKTKSLLDITGIMAVLVALLIFFTQCTIELVTKENTKVEEEKPVEEVPLSKEEIPFSFKYSEHKRIDFDGNGKEIYTFLDYVIYVKEGLTYIENRMFNINTNQPDLDLLDERFNFIPEVGVSYSYGEGELKLPIIWLDSDLEQKYWFELKEGETVYLRIEKEK